MTSIFVSYFSRFYDLLRCSSFTSDFCEINVNLSRKFRTRLSRLFGNHVLYVDHVLSELLNIDSRRVVDLTVRRDIFESIEIGCGVVRVKNGHDWRLILLRRCRIPSRLADKFFDRMFHTSGLVLHHHDENEYGDDEIEVHLLRYPKKNYHHKLWRWIKIYS